ncbi:IS91 family transposase, partial [Propionigenium maris]|uniref:IS91 family transposase n=1 Tax=Propionigenium maris TaxID=45622 RepID=UPI002491D06B
MNSLNKPLKQILSKYFFKYWRCNNHKFPSSLKDNILHNVNRFLECGDPKVGYTSFICLKCKTIHKTPFSCKSRFCSSCGRAYSETWAHNLTNNLINCSHRHAVFSLPNGWLRNIFFKKRHLLKDLAEASYLALKYSFNKMGISTFGSISTIHTFSRKIEWNPHIHCLVTFGGLNKSNQWKNIKNLPWQVLRKAWQKCVLDIIAKYAKNINSQHLKNKVSLTYKRYPNGFYVNAKSKVGNFKIIAKYIGRYLARPAVADYRIIFFNSKIVKFWYQNPDSKKKLIITLT